VDVTEFRCVYQVQDPGIPFHLDRYSIPASSLTSLKIQVSFCRITPLASQCFVPRKCAIQLFRIPLYCYSLYPPEPPRPAIFHPGMVNGRPITGPLSVSLPKREIRRPIGSARLETECGPTPTGFPLIFVSLHQRWPVSRSRTDIMSQ
jgi:hypothetical protein